MSDLHDIKALLQGQILALLAELLPDGKAKGAYWLGARNPTRDDQRSGSMWVRLHSEAGVWKDEATGDTGDVLALVQYCARLSNMGATLAWSREFLKLGTMPEADRQRRAAQAKRRVERDQAELAQRAIKAQRRAFGCYVQAKKASLLGSPVERYLSGRGIDLRRLGRAPGALGWLPSGRHAESNTQWPVMVAGLTGQNNRIVAVHRTFLAADGNDKAPITPHRKIWPSFHGAAVRLWRGESKLSIDDAAKHGLREALVITEGVEDGLSVAMAMPHLRIWCAGSLGNLANLLLPECIDEVIVCQDNDWGKREAQALFNKAIDAFVRQKREVRVARSHVGKDANDALRG